MKTPQRFKKVSEYHTVANLSKPLHPLISLVDYSQVNYSSNLEGLKWIQEYYTIGLKRNVQYKFFYGQQEYDFDEGVMTFIAPNQVVSLGENPNLKNKPSGWLLLIHPDFLWGTPLAKKIKQFDFFNYSINEALFLSEKEEQMMVEILKNIEREYQLNIDQFSQNIIVSQLELLLNYTERFYQRQFITRKIVNHQVLDRLEIILNEAFEASNLLKNGMPSVEEIAFRLNLSSSYLSSLLKSLSGQSTQQHIHDKLIERAKEQLSTTSFSVSEIAFNLGFEQPASFSKLFKNKTKLSPLEFRKTFN